MMACIIHCHTAHRLWTGEVRNQMCLTIWLWCSIFTTDVWCWEVLRIPSSYGSKPELAQSHIWRELGTDLKQHRPHAVLSALLAVGARPRRAKRGSRLTCTLPWHIQAPFPMTSPAIPKSHTRTPSIQEPRAKSAELLSPWCPLMVEEPSLCRVHYSVMAWVKTQILTAIGVLPWLSRYYISIQVSPLHHSAFLGSESHLLHSSCSVKE